MPDEPCTQARPHHTHSPNPPTHLCRQPSTPCPAGSFGKVYLARWNETLVAVKILITPDEVKTGSVAALPPGLLAALQKEAALMASEWPGGH